MYRKTNLVLAFAIGMTVFMTSANAAIITVVNPSFEDPGYRTNKLAGSGNDWDGIDDVPGWTNAGTVYSDSGTTNESGGAHTGSWAGKIGNNDDGVLQLTSHIVAVGDQFTLTFWVEDTWKASTGAAATLFYDTPANVIGTLSFGTTTDWVEHTLTTTATAGSVGGTLGILFEGTSGTFAKIDDVTLSVTQVPEPASLVMGLVGLTFVMARRRRG